MNKTNKEMIEEYLENNEVTRCKDHTPSNRKEGEKVLILGYSISTNSTPTVDADGEPVLNEDGSQFYEASAWVKGMKEIELLECKNVIKKDPKFKKEASSLRKSERSEAARSTKKGYIKGSRDRYKKDQKRINPIIGKEYDYKEDFILGNIKIEANTFKSNMSLSKEIIKQIKEGGK